MQQVDNVRLQLLASALAALTLVGCPDVVHTFDSGPHGDGGADASTQPPDGGNVQDAGAGVPLEDACEVLNESACGFLKACGLVAQGDEAMEDCSRLLTATRCGPARWPARVKAGTLRYNPAAAASCAAAWSTHPCSAYRAEPKICQDVTSAAASLGGKCYGGLRPECTEGVCTGGTCPRSCRLRGDVGEICEETPDCKAGLYCRPASATGALGVCSHPGTNGDACDSERPCAKGWVCGEFSTCSLAWKLGESCQPGTCEEIAYCAFDQQGVGTCLERGSAGAACASDTQCRLHLLCVAELGTCELREGLPKFAPCTLRQSCAAGLTCVGTQLDAGDKPGLGECGPGHPAGAACVSSFDCAGPLACAQGQDGGTGTCTPRFADGDPCRMDDECSLLSACVGASCVRLPQPGEVCPDGACLYGACEPSGDGGASCKGPGGPNAPCEQAEDCGSLRCVSGRCLAACTP